MTRFDRISVHCWTVVHVGDNECNKGLLEQATWAEEGEKETKVTVNCRCITYVLHQLVFEFVQTVFVDI